MLINSDSICLRACVRKGKLPVVKHNVGKEHMSLIAALVPNQKLHVGGQDKAFNSERVLSFRSCLRRRYERKNLIFILDRATIHRNQEATSRSAIIYSQELNPIIDR